MLAASAVVLSSLGVLPASAAGQRPSDAAPPASGPLRDVLFVGNNWAGTCWISLSEADAVAVLDVAAKKELAFLPGGDHPQHVRHGCLPASVVRSWKN